MSSYVSVREASETLEVSLRRVCELVAHGVLGISRFGAGVGIAKADVEALSWPPPGGPE